MYLDNLSKKSLEILGGVGSILTGLFCAGLSVMDERAGQIMWEAWVVMSVVLVVNGIAMQLHARRRDDSPVFPEGNPLQTAPHKPMKART